MIQSILASTIDEDIRAATDQIGSGQVPTATYWSWISLEYQRLRRRLCEIAPELYAQSIDFTLTGTSYQYDLSISAPTCDKVMKCSWLSGGVYVPMRVAEYAEPERQNTAVPGSYRFYFLTTAAPIASGADVLELPAGAQRIISEAVAARVRIRLDDDPRPHQQLARELEMELREEMSSQYRGTPRAISDYRHDDCLTRRWRVRRNFIEVLL